MLENTKQMESYLQALVLGIWASLATLFRFLASLPTWVLFLGWTSYFLLGQNIQIFFLLFSWLLSQWIQAIYFRRSKCAGA